ncbi:MAG: cytochrome c, partial [Bacteroidota bacterium]
MKPWLRWTLWAGAGLVGLFVLVLLVMVIYVNATWDKPSDRRVPAMLASTDTKSIMRGEYLFKNTLLCWECHSASLDANAPPIGGREFDLRNIGPGFGMFYAPNITPDEETGIGSWSDGEIVRALREGIRKDGTTLFPLMPIEAFKGLSDEDVLALVAFMKSIPPVRNPVRRAEMSFMAKVLFAFGAIGPETQIDEPIETPPRSDRVAWGRYLANNASTCMDCHTPRNLQDGSFYRDSVFAGSSVAFGEADVDPHSIAYARNITFDKETGIGNWTDEEFFQ